jgi:mono/diheme cytochrome c family protein
MRRALLIGGFLGLASCNGGENKTNIELIQNMMDQPSVKSQDWVPEDGDKLQMRTPPKGTISRGHQPYAYQSDIAGAEKQPNPLANDFSEKTLAAGKDRYGIYCLVCHGDHGAGDGKVAAKMAVKPRNLMSDDAKKYTDGRIYHAITAGRGVMGSYASQIPDPKQRWQIVNYVRSLQKSN